MRFKVANYSRLEIRLDTLHIYSHKVQNILKGVLVKRLNIHNYQIRHRDSLSRVLAKQLIFGQKVKITWSQSEKHIEGDRRADVRYALYRMPTLYSVRQKVTP